MPSASLRKPRVFIGSSVKGEPIARAVEQNLSYKAETYLWPHMFPQGKGNLEALVETAASIDFAILVLTPDDLLESKGQTVNSPRDNVLFELGLFMGKLGRERTFAVYNRDEQIKLPSDLAGVTSATYPNYSGKNLPAQVSSACGPILNAIDTLGRLANAHAINPLYDFDLVKLDGSFVLAEVFRSNTVVIVVGDGLVSELLDRPVAGVLRDEINRLGTGDPYQRAVIIGHSRWSVEAGLQANPTISIGAELANKLSGEILQAAKGTFELGPGGWGAFTGAIPARAATDKTPATPPTGARAALFGEKAAETRTAAENYLQRREGLYSFLKDHAGWKMA
jgi:predicted nucleotide-binding protein with TIR-like domain